MNRNAFILISVDILLISLISSILALGLYFLNIPFISGFFISFSIICGLGLISNTIIKNKYAILSKELDNKNLKILASQTIFVNCAYCRAQNQQMIRVDKDIEFNCSSCKQPNKVMLQYGAVRVTTPINSISSTDDLIPNASLDKDE